MARPVIDLCRAFEKRDDRSVSSELLQPDSVKGAKRRLLLRFGIVAMVVMVAAPVFFIFDISLSKSLAADRLRGDARKSIALCEFFAHGFGVALILLTIFVLFRSVRTKIPRVALCAIVSGCTANLLKGLVARARPNRASFPDSIQDTFLGWFPAAGFYDETGYAVQSFPSAHTATAFGLAMGLAWLVPRGKWLFFSFAILAALQRIVFSIALAQRYFGWSGVGDRDLGDDPLQPLGGSHIWKMGK